MGSKGKISQRIRLSLFLQAYPGMRVQPSGPDVVRLKGAFAFTAENENVSIKDSYELSIEISKWYPDDLPSVKETGGRIPRDRDYHVNPSGSICLGSPFLLHDITVSTPELTAYAKKAIVPFLYAISRWEKTGERFVFGELAHGAAGLMADYKALLGLTDSEAVPDALRLLGMKRRKANKNPCPCGCGNPLGRCGYNNRIRDFRAQHGRTFFRKLHQQLGVQIS